MKKLIVISCLLFSCANEYWSPSTSKAITEKKQLEQLVIQNKQLKRIADAIERIEQR